MSNLADLAKRAVRASATDDYLVVSHAEYHALRLVGDNPHLQANFELEVVEAMIEFGWNHSFPLPAVQVLVK